MSGSNKSAIVNILFVHATSDISDQIKYIISVYHKVYHQKMSAFDNNSALFLNKSKRNFLWQRVWSQDVYSLPWWGYFRIISRQLKDRSCAFLTQFMGSYHAMLYILQDKRLDDVIWNTCQNHRSMDFLSLTRTWVQNIVFLHCTKGSHQKKLWKRSQALKIH